MNIKYLVVDVDGTMTDGGIYYDENGNEFKKFCTKDAAGFFAAHYVGIKIIVITGRKCKATERRMKELKVNYIYQNIRDKKSFLEDFMFENNVKKEEIGYIGDDLNDFAPMKLTGFVGCPSDGCKEVKEIADYISNIKGGYGAVRDVIEFIFEKEGIWKESVNNIFEIGV